MTRESMFFAYPEGLVSYRLASIRYRNLSAVVSASYGDWPVHKFVDLQTRHEYSHTLLPYEVPPKYLRAANRFRCRVAAEVSTWSRRPITRITVTFSEMRRYADSDARVNIFDIEVTQDANGRDIFVPLHEYKTQEGMIFLTAPSTALRAIIQDAGTGWTSSFALAFNEYEEGRHSERINRLQLPEEGKIVYSTLRMDPLGRMLVYQVPLVKYIAVIRFDE